MSTRTLKIEERGDYHYRRTFPAIRIKGKWLRIAGFIPGQRISLNITAPGVMEVRALV